MHTPTWIALSLSLLSTIRAAPWEKRQEDDEGTGKAGLAWANADTVDMGQFTSTGKVTWYYTWSAWPTDEGRDIEWVPLFWGSKSISDWEQNLPTLIEPRLESGDVKNILAFNEPQEIGQANMSVTTAKELWMEYLHPLKEEYGVRLGSPATSSAPSGKTWTQDFLDECGDDCEVDFIALHWYGVNETHFIEYLEDFHETFKLPLWITEWACHDFTPADDQCTDAQVSRFMNVTQTFMDSVDWVERYAWFGAMPEPVVHESNSIMDSDGEINDLGLQYIATNGTSVINTSSMSTPTFETSLPISSSFPYSLDGSWLQVGSMASPVQQPIVSFSTLGRATTSIALAVFLAILALY